MLNRSIIMWLVAAVLVTASGAMAQDLSSAEQRQGFVSLFNGKNLSGWRVVTNPASWEVRDGAVTCNGQEGGWLRSNKIYEDFILRLEYRTGENSNSGIFLRATDFEDPAFTGMELQILDDFGRTPNKGDVSMALYGAIAPSRNVSKPRGEWNTVEVSLIGRQIKVMHNGVKVIDANLDDKAINDELSPDRKLTDRAKIGRIGLQNHKEFIQYRNIRIRDLKPVGIDHPELKITK